MPAVARPALRCVTRRTLTSVLAWLRSISFCRLRTRLRSPSCDALKIRCRKRRTSSSTVRHSMPSQSRTSPRGPFATATPTAVAVCGASASNLPTRAGATNVFTPKAHLPTSAPFRVRAAARIRPVIHDDVDGGADQELPWFPVAFRPPAFASRVILFPPGTSACLTVGLPDSHCRDPDGVSTFHTSEIRPGRVPSLPRGRRCPPRPDAVPDRRLPLPNGQSLHPATTTHRRSHESRGINEGSRDSPVRPGPHL
jgi:hypothetical protein